MLGWSTVNGSTGATVAFGMPPFQSQVTIVRHRQEAESAESVLWFLTTQ